MAETLGDVLRAAREKKNQTTSEVAAATNIKVQIIEDLEKNDYGRMSAPIYAKGFIKLYAEHLGLDPAPLVALYKARHAAPAATPSLQTDDPATSGTRRKRRKEKKAAQAGVTETAADEPPAPAPRRRSPDDHANILAAPGDEPGELRSGQARPNEKWRESLWSNVAARLSSMAQSLPVDEFRERLSRPAQENGLNEDARPDTAESTRSAGQRALPAFIGIILLVIVIVSSLSRCASRESREGEADTRLQPNAVPLDMTHDLPPPYAE